VQPQAQQPQATSMIGNMRGFMSGVGSGVAKLVVGHPCTYLEYNDSNTYTLYTLKY
jgi:hypothetical protein